MPKVNQLYVQRLGAALEAAYPDRYPISDQDILLGRILWSRYFGPSAWHRIGRESEWHAGEWTHAIGRDRRNQKELLRLVAMGIHEYQGKPIYAKTSEPYVERWSRTDVYEVWLDVWQMAGMDEDKVFEICGVDVAQRPRRS